MKHFFWMGIHNWNKVLLTQGVSDAFLFGSVLTIVNSQGDEHKDCHVLKIEQTWELAVHDVAEEIFHHNLLTNRHRIFVQVKLLVDDSVFINMIYIIFLRNLNVPTSFANAWMIGSFLTTISHSISSSTDIWGCSCSGRRLKESTIHLVVDLSRDMTTL